MISKTSCVEHKSQRVKRVHASSPSTRRVTVRVPATTANMGPGVVAVAVDLLAISWFLFFQVFQGDLLGFCSVFTRVFVVFPVICFFLAL